MRLASSGLMRGGGLLLFLVLLQSTDTFRAVSLAGSPHGGPGWAAARIPQSRRGAGCLFPGTSAGGACGRRCSGTLFMSLSPPSILFQAPSLLVIDKPFGVRMDGEYEDTVERLAKMIVPGKARFIHQLDFATSGALMLGLDKACTSRVNACFERGEVRKEYVALLEGTLEGATTVDVPICRFEGDATLPPRGPEGTHGKSKDFRMMVGEGSDENPGRASLTHIEPLAHGLYQGRPVTRALLRPISGRRHQLRLHTCHIGHEIVGDFTYSCDRERASKCVRMMLHASRIEMPWHGSYGEGTPGGTEGVTWGRTGEDSRVWFQAPDPFCSLLRVNE